MSDEITTPQEEDITRENPEEQSGSIEAHSAYKPVSDKPDNKLQVVTLENIPNNALLEAIYYACDSDGEFNIDQELIDNKHFRIWQAAKNDYIEESKQIVGYKLENLSTSYNTRIKAVKDRLATETDTRIIRMKQSQLISIDSSFKEKKKELLESIAQSDIIVRKLAYGTLQVER